MFGLGYGNRSPLRYLRLGLLILIVLAAVVFHGKGRAYDTIHDVYFVLIIGLLGFALFSRGRSRRNQMGGGPMGGPMGGGGMGGGAMGPGGVGPGQQGPPFPGYGVPPPWSQQVPQPAQQGPQPDSPPAGWYAEPGNPDQERYWDGRAWGPMRHRQDGSSVNGG
jgi:hypothetical protein